MPEWIPEPAIHAMHSTMIIRLGGCPGPIDDDALSSTLARPQQKLTDQDQHPSLFDLAASYGHGFARNRCFTDGNKRIALASISVFLRLNGYELTASEPDAATTFRMLAAGKVSEKNLTIWIEKNVRKAGSGKREAGSGKT